MSNKPLQLGQTQGNFRVGSVAPVMKQPQIEEKVSPLLSFLEGAMPSIQKIIKNDMNTAEVQGALDAAATTDKMEEDNEAVKEYNWWLRDSYKKGYETAAASNLVSVYQKKVEDLGITGVKEGWDDATYSKKLSEVNAEHASELWTRLKALPTDKGIALAEKLRVNNVASLQAFRKETAAAAYRRSDEETNKLSTENVAAVRGFLQKGEGESAMATVAAHLKYINSGDILSKKDKFRHLKNYVSALTTDSTDPNVVNQITNAVYEELGNDGREIMDMLLGKQMAAAQRNTAETMIRVENDIANVGTIPEDKRAGEIERIANTIRYASQNHILGDEKTAMYMRELYKSVDTVKKSDAVKKDLQSCNFTLSALANMYGLSDSEKSKLISENFPASMEGDAALMQFAGRTKDNEALKMAIDRIAERTTKAINGALMLATEDGKVSEATMNQVKMALGIYNGLDPVNRKILLNGFPPAMRNILASTAAQSPNNFSETLFDTIRTVTESWDNGEVQQKYMTFDIDNFKGLDGSKFSEWFSFFGESDQQRAVGLAALAARYNREMAENPTMSLYPNETLERLMDETKADVLSVNMGKFGNVHGYPTAGKKWSDSFAQASDEVRADTESQNKAISMLAKEAIVSLQANGAVVDTARFTMGGGANGTSIAVTAFRKGMGQPMTVYIDQNQLVNAATMLHKDKYNLSKDKMNMMAPVPVFIKNHTTGKLVQITFQGANKWGIAPHVINTAKANIARREGGEEKATTITTKDGKTYKRNGIGVTDRYNTIKDYQTMDESLEQYNNIMDNNYIPTAIRYINKYQIREGDSALPIILDMNYHGGGESAVPVAKAMKAYQDSGVRFSETWRRTGEAKTLLDTLRSTPAYQQSGKERREELENEMIAWMERSTVSSGYYDVRNERLQYQGYPPKRKSIITN